MKRGLHTLHLFAGIGGGIYADLLLGHVPVCAVEVDGFCRSVLLARQRDGTFPSFGVHADVRDFDGRPWRGKVDVVAGGFPCQDVSIAGKRRGLDGERSGLWSEMARIVDEVRPRYVFVENVRGLFTRGFDVVLGDLAALGYDASWGVLGAGSVGGFHSRPRVWILGTDPDAPICGGDRGSRREDHGLAERGPAQAEQDLGTETREDERGERELGSVLPLPPFGSYAGAVRSLHGIPRGSKRLGAVGNAQVPAVAALAWQTLLVGEATEQEGKMSDEGNPSDAFLKILERVDATRGTDRLEALIEMSKLLKKAIRETAKDV